MKKIIKFIMIFSISIILVLSFSSITGFAASADNSFTGYSAGLSEEQLEKATTKTYFGDVNYPLENYTYDSITNNLDESSPLLTVLVHGYLQYSSTKHKAYCTCGNFVLRHHAVSSSATGRYKPCVDCGYLVDTYSDIVIVGPLGTNDLLMTNNGSYILSNGIIVLVDEDIDGYLTGSLIFYNPRDNEELLQ